MSRTNLKGHKQRGKKLLPPFAHHGYSHSSWVDERLPQMLWATLLISNLPREHGLSIFRNVAHCFEGLSEAKVYPDVTHYGLGNIPLNHAETILRTAAADEAAKAVLSSLLIYDELPGKSLWKSVLGGVRVSNPDELVMKAVGTTIWHQSQEATDCRWMRMLPLVVTKRIEMPEDAFREMVNYPNDGEMKRVRPMIRAEELSVTAFGQHIGLSKKHEEWAKAFWSQNLRSFPCFSLLRDRQEERIHVGTTLQHVDEVYQRLIEHAATSRTDTGVDAQHDTTFGLGLYALSIIRELLVIGTSTAIIGRLGLRTILECYVTLAYLSHKGRPDMWRSHRVFGAGQAKLSSLKLEELKSERCFADAETLTEIANEDMWEEFLPINIGHWEDSSLRREAVEAGVKEDYDKYYAWTSTFAHSHWGSVREAVFETCGNPLHRLHRIPRSSCKTLPDVVPDACDLVDKLLDLVSTLYPVFPHRVTVLSDHMSAT